MNMDSRFSHFHTILRYSQQYWKRNQSGGKTAKAEWIAKKRLTYLPVKCFPRIKSWAILIRSCFEEEPAREASVVTKPEMWSWQEVKQEGLSRVQHLKTIDVTKGCHEWGSWIWKILILRPFQLEQKEYTKCGYKHDKTTHVVKTLINDLTFSMSQLTSSEVTAGYNTIRFKRLRERLEPN